VDQKPGKCDFAGKFPGYCPETQKFSCILSGNPETSEKNQDYCPETRKFVKKIRIIVWKPRKL